MYAWLQGCVFTRDIDKAILISDAMETGTVQINSAPARGPDHFPFQVNFLSMFPYILPWLRLKIVCTLVTIDWQGLKDSGIGSQGITNSINMMTKTKSTVINLPTPSYTMG